MRLLLLSALPLLLAAAPAPDVPVYKTFGSWIVACDNVRRCEARGFGDGAAADLRIVRDAGPAMPRATLTWDATPDLTTIQADAKPLELAPPAWSLDRENNALSTNDLAAVAALIAALRDAQSLTFVTPSADRRSIPLQGLSAALLFIDAVQGRPGTPTPLLAPRGNNGVDGAPGLPGRPRWHPPAPLTAAQARGLIAAAVSDPLVIRSLKARDCDSTDRPDIHALDPGHAIVLMPCSHGPYQSWSLAVLIPRNGGPATLFDDTLPALPPSSSEMRGFLVEGGFDPVRGELSMAARGRGPADCGVSATWVWSAGAFRLTREAYLEPCGGAAPGDWPELFRTKR